MTEILPCSLLSDGADDASVNKPLMMLLLQPMP